MANRAKVPEKQAVGTIWAHEVLPVLVPDRRHVVLGKKIVQRLGHEGLQRCIFALPGLNET